MNRTLIIRTEYIPDIFESQKPASSSLSSLSIRNCWVVVFSFVVGGGVERTK